MNIEGKYVDVIGVSVDEMPVPKFKNFKNAILLQRSAEHMSCPIFDVDDQLCLNIQLMSRKQKNTKYFAGFTNLDEILFQSLLAVVQAKLHFVKANQAKRRT